GFGPDYGMMVRSVTSQARAFFADGESSFQVPTGEPTRIDVLVQNTGTRLSSFNLTWSGATAGWVTGVPATIVLAPASSQNLSIALLVPEGTKDGRYALDLRLAPPANEGVAATTRIDLLVGDVEAAEEDPQGIPAPSWLALAALGLAAVAARRRR
ncbi:MAG TPA: MYXO-CTERM sorting domain-containing protein, partial [Candidatus Thermoplasmatota archaeon]|nr:MYXO-CTERM sorting domain-containing protein [Candidatus Thermoplasmatota archaeon]